MLQLTPEQIERFVAAGERDLVKRILAFVSTEVPELLEDVPAGARRARIAGTIPDAKRIGVETDLGVTYFAMLSLLMGAHFEEQPDIAAYLRSPDLPIEALLDNLFEEIARLADSENP